MPAPDAPRSAFPTRGVVWAALAVLLTAAWYLVLGFLVTRLVSAVGGLL